MYWENENDGHFSNHNALRALCSAERERGELLCTDFTKLLKLLLFTLYYYYFYFYYFRVFFKAHDCDTASIHFITLRKES